jgi:NAD(P)-dependent dehydrogenase (short-subunit alcohol dehydrogenase family)
MLDALKVLVDTHAPILISFPTDGRGRGMMLGAQVAVVTGGRRGIGAAIASRFLDEGWRCAVLDADLGAAPDADARVGAQDEAMLVRCDVRRTSEVEDAVRSVLARFGRVDAVVNNAGTVRPAASHEIIDDDWSELLEVHLGGAMRVSRAALVALLRSDHPSVVNISSVCAAKGFPGRLSYNSAKAGIEALTRTLAVEWGHLRVRVNAVAPGFILTENSRRLYESGVADQSTRQALIPLGRLGEPREVANAVYWLASPEASYVNGHVLTIDGGYVISGRTGPDQTDRSRQSIEQSSPTTNSIEVVEP